MTSVIPVTPKTPQTPNTDVNEAPVTNQPKTAFKVFRQNTVAALMPPPKMNYNCAPGLEYLSDVDQIVILQKIEPTQSKFEGPCKFILRTSSGQQIYTAEEESDFVKREFYRTIRPLKLRVISNSEQEIMVLNRPLKGSGCCWSCCKCCFQNVEVMTTKGNIMGYIHQEKSCCQAKYTIKNAAEDVIFRIMGPPKTCFYLEDTELTILNRNGQKQVGSIAKTWSGPSRDNSLKADKLTLKYTVELDVTSKALILAGTFLMDFMYYEDRHRGVSS